MPATVNASIIAANMWKNSLKNVESDNNKILYETLLIVFYREMVLTFRISLVVAKYQKWQTLFRTRANKLCRQAKHIYSGSYKCRVRCVRHSLTD